MSSHYHYPHQKPAEHHFDFWFWVLLVILLLMGVKYNNAHDVIPALRFGNTQQAANQTSGPANSNNQNGANSSSSSASQPGQGVPAPSHSVNAVQHRYSTSTAAASHTGYQSKSELSGLNRVNLGNHQSGYIDHGAGQTYVVFYVGRWSIKVHGSSDNSAGVSPQTMAQRLAAYFRTHSLPTNENGSLDVDSNRNVATASYQKNNQVVTDKGGNVDRVLQDL